MAKQITPEDAKLLLESIKEAKETTGFDSLRIVANAKWCKCEFNRRYKRQIHNLSHMAVGSHCRNI